MEAGVAGATERVVVLMTPGEKRALERKARATRLSAGELVRRSIAAFDPRLGDAAVLAMLDGFTATHAATIAALDRAERELAETRDYFMRKREGDRA
jgi:hypothetical protein